MMLAYRFLSPAADEVAESLAYYTDISADVRQAFLDDLEKVIDRLRHFPKTGTAVEHTFRSLPLTRFPFTLIYKIEGRDEMIIIVAVAHHKRRPGYWKGRA